jgi:predicted patatin/cPLA2 family phospholipase
MQSADSFINKNAYHRYFTVIYINHTYKMSIKITVEVIRLGLPGDCTVTGGGAKCIPYLFRRFPSLKMAVMVRDSHYNELLDFIKNLPSDFELTEICPAVFNSGFTMRNRELLNRDYTKGKRIGFLAIQKWN